VKGGWCPKGFEMSGVNGADQTPFRSGIVSD
jgi:hypothetical protein